jgi:hypothetical protein
MVPRLALELELGDAAMKTTLFLFCLLCTTAAFAQYGGSISSQPQIYEAPSHPAHASYAPMAREQNNLASSTFSFAQGERPASDFPQQATAVVSLGAVARELRQQHAQLKKSRVVWANQ